MINKVHPFITLNLLSLKAEQKIIEKLSLNERRKYFRERTRSYRNFYCVMMILAKHFVF